MRAAAPAIAEELLEHEQTVDDLDDGDLLDDDAPIEPPARPHSYSTKLGPPHRQAGSTPQLTEKPHGVSSWVGKPREGFTASQTQRAEEIGRTKEARSVKGLPGE